MRWYGKIQELAQLIFRKSGFAVTVEPVSASADTVFQLPAAGGGTKSLTTADSATVFTNKTFDADASGNSISNIENADIKAGAAIDAAKIHDGSVSNTEFGHLNGVASAILGKDDAGTFTNKTIAAGSNTITGLTKSDVGLGNVDNTSDATKNAAVAVLTNKDIDGGTASNSNRFTIPKNTKANLDTLTRKEGTLVFATDTQSAYLDYNSTLNPLGGAGVTLTVTQTAHGFTSSNIGAPLYLNGAVYTLAKGDAANTAEVVGHIDTVIDVNTFGLKEAGSVSVNTAVSGGALTAGAVYFLSATSAGQITTTEPTTVGHVSKPLGVANSTSTLILTPSRGVTVGGANARTTISLANNATTTVQDVSAYAAGELSGWVNIAATTPLQFYVQAQFAKNGAATDYNIAYQTTGDTPPTGFSLTVTSGGLVQAVLPSITGYTSASINYALNAPAVGTSFPLSLNQSALVVSNTADQYSANTRLGQMVYTHSGSYNGGGAPTITSGESGFTVNGSEFIPYQMSDGSWRCRFNIQMSMNSATRTSITFVPNGVIGANAFEQAFYGWDRSASSSTQLCRVNQNTSNFDVYHTSATTTSYTVAGDIKLQSKPTWAY